MPSEIPHVSCIKTIMNQTIVNHCPSFFKFTPLFWAKNGVLQTILQYVLLPVAKKRYARQMFAFSDGVESSLDWKYAEGFANAPIVLCLHGLGGDSSSNYMKLFTNFCQQNGYTTVVYNRRGHAKESLLPKVGNISNASCIFPRHVNMNDMKEVVDIICKRFPQRKKFLVGFSCGGNLAINYLDHVGKDSPFKAAVVISNGYNISVGSELLKSNKYFNNVATNFMKDLLKDRLEECKLIAKEKNMTIDWNVGLKAKSIPDFDTWVASLYGLSLEEYYSQDSSHDKLKSISIPLLCITNNSDPFVHYKMNRYPNVWALSNSNIIYVETKSGGHIGWIESLTKQPWYIRLICEYLYVFNHPEIDRMNKK